MQSALGRFARDGFEGASMGAISGGAQVAHGTVFWHFGSKSRLYLAVMRRASDQLACTMRPSSTSRRGSLREVMERLIRFLDSNPEICGLIASLPHDSPRAEVREGARLLNARLLEVWREPLEGLAKARGVATARRRDDLTRLITATIEGVLEARLGGRMEGWGPLEALVDLVEQATAGEVAVDGTACCLR